jgi:C-terminal processing protease CtpA/Prc
VVFDYSRKQMILEPNANFSETYEFDMSGMFVMTDAERLDLIQVREVLEASPAFDAGIRPGDVIAALDDRPAAQLGLDQVRRMFKEREGKEYVLSVRRGDRSLQFKIQLRRLI